jgi:predicted dehydrogenase
MDKRLRIGLVGLGAVAGVHMKAYQGITTASVVSVADTEPSRMALTAQKLGVRGYSTLREMLLAESLDIVCVLTPPGSHEELVRLCAEARVHVLCEKPLALSVESCERMIEACRANGVRLCYGASYRYLSALNTAREMIRAGSLGQVLLLREYAVGGLGPARRATLDFNHYPRGGPGGSAMGLCDHGIHLIDAFPWLIDSPTVGVWGRGNVSGEAQEPEFVHLAYANGAYGQLLYEDGTYTTALPAEGSFSWGGGWSVSGPSADDVPSGSWHPDPGCIHVHGTRGSLRILHYANVLFFRDSSGVRQIRLPDQPVPANFTRQLEAFVDAIRFDSQTPVPGEAGLEAIRTLIGVYERKGVPASCRPDVAHCAQSA